MKRLAGESLSPGRRQRLVQLLFVFVNLALVETHLPGPLWLTIGAIFWLALIGISVAGSGLVCGTMCWIGAIQDFFEPLARPRLRIDARFGRAFTLTLLILWMPIGWLVVPTLAAHDRSPLNVSFGWELHLFQFALAAVVAASVMVLGKRGICRYFCPFNSIVAGVRKYVLRQYSPGRTRTPVASSTEKSTCQIACTGCNANRRATGSTAQERIIA
jgi:polyferredoxin